MLVKDVSYWCCLCISMGRLYFAWECVLFCALSLKLLMLSMYANLLLLLSFLKWGCAKLESIAISLAIKTKEVLKKHLNKLFKTRFP